MLRLVGFGFVVAFGLVNLKAAAAGPNRPACFSALRQGGSAPLSCEHKAWMTDDERASVTKLTRGYLLDASCVVTVDVQRAIVDEALTASDRAFVAPPQPVTCVLQTSGGPMTIGGTFAPRVTFKDGFAVDASPGLANITGVNSYLAMPVVAWVNNAPSIRREMASMINDMRARSQTRASR
jgi:hypothetical protein